MAKKTEQPSRRPTRRQLAVSKREREQLRLVYLGLGLVVVLILIALIYGVVQTYLIEPNSAVAKVNNQKIITKDYQNRVLYERFLLEDQFAQVQTQVQALPTSEANDQLTQMIRNQYQQLAQQIQQQRDNIDRQTLDIMIDDQLIAVEATKRGLTVTDEEITEAVNRVLAARQGGLTTAAAAETSTARAKASATAALWTPTPTFTPSPTLTRTETLTQPTPTPANTPTPAPTNTPNIVSPTDLTTQYNGWVQTINEKTGLNETLFRAYVKSAVLRDKIQAAIGSEVPPIAEQAQARHILVKSEDEAKEVVKRLKAGEDFAELAQELSTDPGSASSGGDLGFVSAGTFVAAIDEAVFSLPIGQVSEPIETQFGWHVVEVLKREKRELSPSDYSRQQRQAYLDWLSGAREKVEIEDFWAAEKAPPDPLLRQF